MSIRIDSSETTAARADVLTPPRGGARPNPSLRELAGVATLAVAATLVFYSTLLFGGSLNGYDWA